MILINNYRFFCYLIVISLCLSLDFSISVSVSLSLSISLCVSHSRTYIYSCKVKRCTETTRGHGVSVLNVLDLPGTLEAGVVSITLGCLSFPIT